MQEFQKRRAISIQAQHDYIEEIKAKGEIIINSKKLGNRGVKELDQIVKAQLVNQQAHRIHNLRDKIMATTRSDYDGPPMMHWNEVELKLEVLSSSAGYKIFGDIDADDGTAFAYQIMTFFPQKFQEQVI